MTKNKKYETISFLSDFGISDEFVGVVHSVIHSIAPFVKVIDITHGIPHYDIRSGGLALARSSQYLSPGVVLAVVDPGVGTQRRAIAVEVGGGESVLVGPDNGLLAPTVALVGGADRAVSLTETKYQLPAPGPTFAGRDIFGPAAAHIAAGVDLLELGEEIDVSTLMPGLIPIVSNEPDGIHTEVLWIDQFAFCLRCLKILEQEEHRQMLVLLLSPNQPHCVRKKTVISLFFYFEFFLLA